jgi:predicted nucleic acid-binding Zn ribbon protein
MPDIVKNCEFCAAEFTAIRSTRRFCSDLCRISFNRNRPSRIRAIPLYRAVAEEPGAEDATVRAVSLIMIFGIIIAFIEIVLLVILG